MTAHSTGFQRPSCLQQSLKFLQLNLAPFLPAVNAPASTAVCQPLPPPSRLGPRSLVPMGQRRPHSSLRVSPSIPQNPLRSRPWPTLLAPGASPALQIIAQAGVRHASCTNVDMCANTPGRSWHACLCPLLPEPGCSHLTVIPSLPHQSLLPLEWADSWVRPAPVAPQGTRGRQEIDPLNFSRL